VFHICLYATRHSIGSPSIVSTMRSSFITLLPLSCRRRSGVVWPSAAGHSGAAPKKHYIPIGAPREGRLRISDIEAKSWRDAVMRYAAVAAWIEATVKRREQHDAA